MTHVYSTYEAKAKFSEVIARVRAGHRVLITYRGEQVAEVCPVRKSPSFEERLERLEAEGVVVPPEDTESPLRPVRLVEGALQRFLEDRD